MNFNNSSIHWPWWQLTNELLWILFLLLLVFVFVMLGGHVPTFWYLDWATNWKSDRVEQNGRRQAVVPYPKKLTHESSSTIGKDRLTSIHLGHAQTDADHDTRISGVWRPPQGDLSTPVDDTNSNQQPRQIEVFTIDRWDSTTESSPRTDCVDLSEYEVHIEDMESMLISQIHPFINPFTDNSV